MRRNWIAIGLFIFVFVIVIQMNSKSILAGTYTYDSNDRITSVLTSDGSKYNFRYDANGNLISRTVVPYLSSLVLNTNGTPISLTPEFSKTVICYNAEVKSYINTITVTPTTNNSNYSITVQGATVISGQQSAAINLCYGGYTAINIVVSNGECSRTYVINVLRPNSAYLSGLTLMVGKNTVVPLSPDFSGRFCFSYTAITLQSPLKVYPTLEDTTSLITVTNNGNIVNKTGTYWQCNLISGTNNIAISISPILGQPICYTLYVHKN